MTFISEETLNTSPHISDSGIFDDDDYVVINDKASNSKKPRRPPNTAERRATHNAIERARRESLNGRFLDLAAKLPGMEKVKRPSKNAIVNKSIDFIHEATEREKKLRTENDILRRELEQLRAMVSMGINTRVDTTPGPLSASSITAFDTLKEDPHTLSPIAIPGASLGLGQLPSPAFSDFSTGMTPFDKGAESDSGHSSFFSDVGNSRRTSDSSSSLTSVMSNPAMMASNYNPRDIMQAQNEIQAHLLHISHHPPPPFGQTYQPGHSINPAHFNNTPTMHPVNDWAFSFPADHYNEMYV